MSDYLIGLFAINFECFAEVKALFVQSSDAMANLDDDWNELQGEAYTKAKESSKKAVELSDLADVAPLTAFSRFMQHSAPQALSPYDIYSPKEAPVHLETMRNIEASVTGEAGMVDAIWREDTSLNKDGIGRFYRAYKSMLEFAAENGCGFGMALLS